MRPMLGEPAPIRFRDRDLARVPKRVVILLARGQVSFVVDQLAANLHLGIVQLDTEADPSLWRYPLVNIDAVRDVARLGFRC